MDLSQSLGFDKLRDFEFQFLEFFFREINLKASKFNVVSSTREQRLLTVEFDLIGLDVIYKIALQAQDTNVGMKAIYLLNTCFNQVSKNLENQFQAEREKYLGKWMTHLKQSLKDYQSTPSKALAISRCLSTLKVFIEEYEIKLGIGSEKHGTSENEQQDQDILIKATFLKTGGNVTMEFKMKKSDLIGKLRQQIAKKLGTEELSRMVHLGVQLVDDDMTIAEANIHETVWVVKKAQEKADSAKQKLNLSEVRLFFFL